MARLNFAVTLPALLSVFHVSCRDAVSDRYQGVGEGVSVIAVERQGLQDPRAVVYDSLSDSYLVANGYLNGSDREVGFLSRLSPQGKIIDLKWIDGAGPHIELENPAGMLLYKDLLYVADLKCLKAFHRDTGTMAWTACPETAQRLNDVTVDHSGALYVTDGGTELDSLAPPFRTVYRVDARGVAEAFVGTDIGAPTSILATQRGIFVTNAAGVLYQVGAQASTEVLRSAGSELAGLTAAGNGSIAFASAGDSAVYYLKAKYGGTRADLFTLIRPVDGPGDLGYDSRRHRVLVPERAADRVLFIDLGG